jgi:hypothetical protein
MQRHPWNQLDIYFDCYSAYGFVGQSSSAMVEGWRREVEQERRSHSILHADAPSWLHPQALWFLRVEHCDFKLLIDCFPEHMWAGLGKRGQVMTGSSEQGVQRSCWDRLPEWCSWPHVQLGKDVRFVVLQAADGRVSFLSPSLSIAICYGSVVTSLFLLDWNIGRHKFAMFPCTFAHHCNIVASVYVMTLPDYHRPAQRPPGSASSRTRGARICWS